MVYVHSSKASRRLYPPAPLISCLVLGDSICRRSTVCQLWVDRSLLPFFNYLYAGRSGMSITVEAINHVGLVVKDLQAAERFYGGILGLRPHHVRPSWFVLNATSTLHLIPFRDSAADDPPHHAYRHVALQVPGLRAVASTLLAAGLRVYQADFSGGERDVTSVDDPMDFGVGTIFVRDPDGNLIEFLQLGHGIFTDEMQPRITD